jgi:hypothetical protein
MNGGGQWRVGQRDGSRLRVGHSGRGGKRICRKIQRDGKGSEKGKKKKKRKEIAVMGEGRK